MSHLEAINWPAISADLDAQGWAVMPKLLSAKECESVASLYQKDEGFRSKVVMARHGFERGEYKYFAYPLPPLIETLRTALYPNLARLLQVQSPARRQQAARRQSPHARHHISRRCLICKNKTRKNFSLRVFISSNQQIVSAPKPPAAARPQYW
jgi:hypothetical protein